MNDVIENAVARVIRAMHENLGEPITIDDMARAAMFSKFHFSRIFHRVTGVSPGRFLSALRLHEAKRLLLTSPSTVADISHLVGYNSIGTFSSRFRATVGMSPTEYRQRRGIVAPLSDADPVRGARASSVHGRLVWPTHLAGQVAGQVVVGLFPDRLAQGRPVRHVTVTSEDTFVLDHAPEGTWHVLAHSTGPHAVGPVASYVAAHGPVHVVAGVPVVADLRLRQRRLFDPPVLLAQLDQPLWTVPVPGRTDQAVLPGA